jgi:hypothetical protein
MDKLTAFWLCGRLFWTATMGWERVLDTGLEGGRIKKEGIPFAFQDPAQTQL